MKAPPAGQYHSALTGIGWPAVPAPRAAAALAIQFQLDRSQWLAPEELRGLQFRQLDAVVRHAAATVPFYRETWRGAVDPARALSREQFDSLPLLTRNELQANFAGLTSTAVPEAHGRTGVVRTSGSTGQPVEVAKTELTELFWRAVLLREHRWFERDLGGKLASIRQGVPEAEAASWGSATDELVQTGPRATLPMSADIDTQLAWLERQQPDYLLTYPSNLAELARSALERGARLPRLREVRTFGEHLGAETRALARSAWSVPVTDAYSTVEAGYLALQCPAHEHYHVQSETVLVEVLDERGRPCAAGDTGRVVVTTLTNFAMPLVRYDIGDYAQVGAACGCGRGLPVLERIVGRVRNMLVTADGKRYWPMLGTRSIMEIAPVRQYQLVQKAYDLIEARIVPAVELRAEQEDALRRHLLSRLPSGLRLQFVYLDHIARGPGGKFEDFVSELGAGGR